jgi:hypothetical protein
LADPAAVDFCARAGRSVVDHQRLVGRQVPSGAHADAGADKDRRGTLRPSFRYADSAIGRRMPSIRSNSDISA